LVQVETVYGTEPGQVVNVQDVSRFLDPSMGEPWEDDSMPDPVVRAESGPHKGCPVLKPCPFCGSTEALRFEFSGSQGYIVCDSCYAMGPCDAKAADPICDVDAAYNAWNRRATAHA
jgi:Lar family restriction alleviation protein